MAKAGKSTSGKPGAETPEEKKGSLVNVLLLSLAAVTFIIGVHQTLTVGIGAAYAIYMFAVLFLFLYWYRTGKLSSQPAQPNQPTKPVKGKKGKTSKNSH